MRNWLLFFSLLIIFNSCADQKQQKIIPRKDLVSLMVDLHIADAMSLNNSINEQFGGLDSALLYNTVLKSHGYTKEQFIYSLNYYAQEPEKLINIYDEVFAALSKQSEETKALYESYSVTQTRNIWKPKLSRYLVKGDTVHYPPMFDFAIDTTGNFIVVAEIKVTPKDESVNPRILAYFYNPKDDIPKDRICFEEIKLLKTYYKREFILSKECTDPDFSRMRIIIPMHDSTDSLFFKDFEMSNLRVALAQPPKNK
jgi:hypothetical protein